MRFQPKPIIALLACAVLSAPLSQAADSSCATGQPTSEALHQAVSGAMESVRSEVFNPNIESQMADIRDAIALLDQQRAEIQTILAAWDPAAAADWLAQMANTMNGLVIDLCRLGCPSGGADVVLQMKDKVYEYVNNHNLVAGQEALSSKRFDVEKLARNYPSRKVKRSARTAHNLAGNINASIQRTSNDGNDGERRNSLAKLDDKLGKLQSYLLSLNSRLANLETQNAGFPVVFANITERSFKTGNVEISCSESHSAGGDGGTSISSSSSHSSDVSGGQ